MPADMANLRGRRGSLSERTVAVARQVLAGEGRRLARLLGFRRSRGYRLDRLRRPGQLRHQHPGRREIRLRAAMGGRARQSDRDAVPGAFGQARHRHRPQSGGDVPRSLSAADRAGDVGRQRDCRHGDRSRRIPRRRHRTFTAVSHAALGRNGRDRDPDLRPVDVRALRLPADRADHRRHGERDCALLRRRDVHCADRLGLGRRAHGRAANRRRAGAAACGRHYRGNRDAARGLSAFRVDANAHAGARRQRAPQWCCVSPIAKSSSRLRLPASSTSRW